MIRKLIFPWFSIVFFVIILSSLSDKSDRFRNLSETRNNSSLPCMDTNIIEFVFNITGILSWTDLVILYDDEGVDILVDYFHKVETGYANKASIYYLGDWRENETSLLLTISKNFFPNISILLFGGKHAFQLMRIANTIDSKSNRYTDYRHKSKWLIVQTNASCVYSVMNLADVILENIVVIECLESTFEVYTFEYSSKRFVHVSVFTKDNLYPNMKYGFNGRHFLIAGHVSPQFFLKHVNNGNVTYSGYGKTFADAMSVYLNCSYTFVEPEDNQWGNLVNGTWDGLIGQLLRREVDMAVAELTLTEDREKVVDFLLPPFFTQGLGMVFQKTTDTSKGWFNIFQPYQIEVYYTIIGGTACFSLLMYILEKTNPLNERTETLISIQTEMLSLSNLFISVFGCVCLSGDGIRPRTCTGRLLTFLLWLFCVVMAGTFSGNLTASLLVHNEKAPFTTLQEMVELDDWTWGVHPATFTASLLKSSPRPEMKKAWIKILKFNQSDQTVLSTKSDEHIDRVIGGKYAYISLDPLLFKLRRNDCLFDTITNVLTTQHVALAVSDNSPFRPEIQRFLFRLFEQGFLQVWEQIRYKDNRPRDCFHTEPIRIMYLEDIKGAFGVLGLGITLAIGFLLAENLHKLVFKLQ